MLMRHVLGKLQDVWVHWAVQDGVWGVGCVVCAGPLLGGRSHTENTKLRPSTQGHGMEKGVWLHPSPDYTPLPPGSWSAVTGDKQLGYLSTKR